MPASVCGYIFQNSFNFSFQHKIYNSPPFFIHHEGHEEHEGFLLLSAKRLLPLFNHLNQPESSLFSIPAVNPITCIDN